MSFQRFAGAFSEQQEGENWIAELQSTDYNWMGPMSVIKKILVVLSIY